MKMLIVYYSKFGNTKRVAETIAATMKSGPEVRVVSIDRLAASDFEGIDVVVMGTPTHGFTIPAAARSVLTALPPGILLGKAVAAFDTTVRPWPLRHLRASSKLLRVLRHLGGRPIAPPQTFFVQTRNPQRTGEINLLLEGQLERAREWASQLLVGRASPLA